MLFCRELPKLYMRIADQTNTAPEINQYLLNLWKKAAQNSTGILFIHKFSK